MRVLVQKCARRGSLPLLSYQQSIKQVGGRDCARVAVSVCRSACLSVRVSIQDVARAAGRSQE